MSTVRWFSNRERARRKARHDIQQRIQTASVPTDDSTLNDLDGILDAIVNGHRSLFSATFVNEHVHILTYPVSIKHLWRNGSLLGHEILVSWLRHDGFEEFTNHLQSLDSFTVLEWAIWMRRYAIVGSLLLHGINPCVRGQVRGQAPPPAALAELGRHHVVPALHAPVPLPLASYMVQRVVQLRQRHCATTETTCCLRCQGSLSGMGLTYEDGHCFCESCFWHHVLARLVSENNMTGAVVDCPVCGDSDGAPTPVVCSRTESLANYHALPANKAALQQRPHRQRCPPVLLAATWATAVAPSLGGTRVIRDEKWLAHAAAGHYRYVWGCLQAGVDASVVDEYGQTALYLAAWRGQVGVVRLLLAHWGDEVTLAIHQASHGGSTPLTVAQQQGHDEIVQLLSVASACADAQPVGSAPLEKMRETVRSTSTNIVQPCLRVLIEPHVNHPGAGSFWIDTGFDQAVIDALIDLWETLPTEPRKPKAVPCSVRSYFCDAEDDIGALLRLSLHRALGEAIMSITVFPYMRFLSYTEPGAVLAPHIDLFRDHPFTKGRSTHSFLLYLTNCERGGETTLLEGLSGESKSVHLAKVQPRRGRLLLFPHDCPHQGDKVEDVPKLLIRGEVLLPSLNFSHH